MFRIAATVVATSLLACALPGECETGRQGAQGRVSGIIIQDGKARGTILVVRPTILPDGQIRVRLIPQVSYFSLQGDGSIEFSESATEVVVPNGHAMLIGGATLGINQMRREILGYSEQQSSTGSSFMLTAAIQ